MLGKLDLENLVAIMERPTTVFAGAVEATTGAMLYAKLQACIQQLDNERRQEQIPPDNKDQNNDPPPDE